MEFKTITISELVPFVRTDLYNKSKNCPITVHRAISQSKNPRADKSDPALTIAISNNNIVGYIGYLPDKIGENKVYWNSCWWVEDDYKTIAIPLLLQFVKTAKEKIVLTDLTPHTKQIVSNLPFFSYNEMESGFRGYLKFNTEDVFPNKKPQLKKIKPLLKIGDKVANSLITKKSTPQNLIIEKIGSFSEKDKKFISSKNSSELFKRNTEELEWIYNNPWVKNTEYEYSNYYFTAALSEFNTQILRIKDSNDIVAILYLKNQDKHLTISFSYIEQNYFEQIAQFIYNYAINNSCITITSFNSELNKCFENNFSFITTRLINRDFVFHNSIQHLIKKPVILQDGDGDVAFC